LPAIGDEHERREKRRHRRADVAGTEDVERIALLLGRIPARYIGNANRERTAGDPDAEPRQQHLRIRVSIGQRERRGRGG
jgi:hypothetical protein